MLRRTAPVLISATLVVAVVGAACNDDGRDLRPARPDQNKTISTTSTTVTTTPSLSDIDVDAGAGGLGAASGGGTAAVFGATTTIAPGTADELVAPWAPGGLIDARYTCEGANSSPALAWPAAGADVVEVAVTMVDLDAPGFAHWAMAGVNLLTTTLDENAEPEGVIVGTNGAGSAGYTGPCPPVGSTHEYRITVHHLRTPVELEVNPGGAELLAEIEAASARSWSITGTYSR